VKKLLVFILIVILAAAGYGLFIYTVSGGFKSIAAAPANACRKVAGIVWPEDITIDPRNGMALITGMNRKPGMAGAIGPDFVYGYDMTQPDAKPVKLTVGFPMQPHGLSLFAAEGGGGTVMVVSHRHWLAGKSGEADAIEIFDYAGGTLTHRKTVADPRLTYANDVVAVAPDRFYVTIDHGYGSGIMRKIEDYGRVPWGYVLYYDGSSLKQVADGIRYPNGITISADGKMLYVASTTQPALIVYDRDPATAALSNRRDIALPSGADNLERDDKGRIWTGAHPQLLKTAAALSKPGLTAPSEVLRIDPASGEVKSVYLDDGSQIGLSSGAAVWKDRLLIGSIGGDFFLDCTLKADGLSVK